MQTQRLPTAVIKGLDADVTFYGPTVIQMRSLLWYLNHANEVRWACGSRAAIKELRREWREEKEREMASYGQQGVG